eukprot:scaffold11716_cov165-Amphora_coffeaeformis.AAC.6
MTATRTKTTSQQTGQQVDNFIIGTLQEDEHAECALGLDTGERSCILKQNKNKHFNFKFEPPPQDLPLPTTPHTSNNPPFRIREERDTAQDASSYYKHRFIAVYTRSMQFRTQIPKEPTPSGLVLVQTDQGHGTLQVRLPPEGQPGDSITFEVPENAKPDDEPILAELEQSNNNKPSLIMRICCCCIYICCPDGIVVSEWCLAFMIGLYIGLSLMLGFALGTLSIRQDYMEPEL